MELQLSGAAPKLRAPPNPRHPRICLGGLSSPAVNGCRAVRSRPSKTLSPGQRLLKSGKHLRGRRGFSDLTQLFPRCVSLSSERVLRGLGFGVRLVLLAPPLMGGTTRCVPRQTWGWACRTPLPYR